MCAPCSLLPLDEIFIHKKQYWTFVRDKSE